MPLWLKNIWGRYEVVGLWVERLKWIWSGRCRFLYIHISCLDTRSDLDVEHPASYTYWYHSRVNLVNKILTQCVFPFQSEVYYFGDSCFNCLKKVFLLKVEQLLHLCCQRKVNQHLKFKFYIWCIPGQKDGAKNQADSVLVGLLPQCRGVAKVTSPPPSPTPTYLLPPPISVLPHTKGYSYVDSCLILLQNSL